MILNCPNCQVRYLVPDAAIGDEGREVKCAKCSYEWFEEPPESLKNPDTQDQPITGDDFPPFDDENNEPKIDNDADRHIDDDPIPESIKPLHSKNDEDTPTPRHVPATARDIVTTNQRALQSKLVGYGGAIVIFVILLLGGVLYKNTIIETWPPATLIYQLAGMPPTLKGEGLVIESLNATVMKNEAEEDVLVLKGRVINLSNETVNLPQMIAILRSTNGENGESWLIAPPVDQIKPQASFTFASDYTNIPKGVGSVNLQLVPAIDG